MAVVERTGVSPTRHARVGDSTVDVGQMFEQHSDRLLAYCVRFLGSRSDAEDAVQTTFLYAHRALERGVVPEAEYPWLHSIAKNVCRWQLRTVARRGSLSTAVDLDAIPSRTQGLADDEREFLAGLPDALASMPEAQRRAILMREWHGLSSGEIAARMGMSPAATYALLTRARRSLAHALTTAARKPMLGLNFGSILLKLKGLVAGATAKVVATGVAVGTIAVGGVAIERSNDGSRPAVPPAPVLDTAAGSESTSVGSASSVSDAVGSVLPSVVTRGQGATAGSSAGPNGGATGAGGPATPTSPEGATPTEPQAGTSTPVSTLPTSTLPAVPDPRPLLPDDPTELVPVDVDLPPLPSDLVPPLLDGDTPLDEVVPDLPPAPPAPLPLPDVQLPLP